jgi:hypothetical protein
MLKRLSLVSLVLLVASGAFAAPIKYNVLAKEKDGTMAKIGTLLQETSGDDASGYVDESTLTLEQEGHKATFHELTHYGKDGMDTSKTFDFTPPDGPEIKIKATLDDSGAKVTVWKGDDKDEKQIDLASKTPRADATNFWFKTVHPKEGDSVTYQSFSVEDPEDLAWTDVTLKLVGKKTVKVGGKDVEANEIDRTEGEDKSTIYVDDKGDAVLVIQADGNLRFERDTSA